MNNANALVLKNKSEELRVLLKDISDLYEPAKDEFLNEMFYGSLYKAKEFNNTLDYILKKEEKCDDPV